MNGHTPAPWRMSDKFEYGTGYGIYANGSRLGEASYLGGTDPAKANAAFIVKAVNNHDALVKALQFIADGYDNQDVNHVDFRVKAYQVAIEVLELVGSPPDERDGK